MICQRCGKDRVILRPRKMLCEPCASAVSMAASRAKTRGRLVLTLYVDGRPVSYGHILGPKKRYSVLDWLAARRELMGRSLTGIQMSYDECAWYWGAC